MTIGQVKILSEFKKKAASFFILLSFLSIEIYQPNQAIAQDNNQDSLNDSLIGDFSDLNSVNQNALQNQNIVTFPDRVIRPLDNPIYTPPNTENDLGFNFSAGFNLLDPENTTLYFGLIFHPGRTASHKARIRYLRQKTEILELEQKTMEAKLKLLENQIQEAELRLQQLK